MMNYYENRRQRIMASLADGDCILDVGCAHRPNPYLHGRRVIGLDLIDMDIHPPYTEHIVGDIADLGALLPGQKFNTILMGEFIEHLEEPYEILRSVHDKIAPGGALILSTPNPLGIPVVIAEYLCLRKFYYTKNHTFYFSPRWMWRLLERSGYKLQKPSDVELRSGGFGCRLPCHSVIL